MQLLVEPYKTVAKFSGNKGYLRSKLNLDIHNADIHLRHYTKRNLKCMLRRGRSQSEGEKRCKNRAQGILGQ